MSAVSSGREAKLAAAPSFQMPALDDLADGVTASSSEPERLSTTYFDTPDLRLARWGVSFRHWLGEGWTVTLSPESEATVLAQPELTFPADTRRPPADAVDLVRAFTRGADLSAQTRLRTLRQRVALTDAAGNVLAAVVDDEVSVLEGRRLAARFRELAVALADETPPEFGETLLERLRRAGAGAPDPTPNYRWALAPRAELPPEVTVAQLSSGATAGDVVRRAIAASIVGLIEHDPVIRLDADPEGVHQARVATRRLRSDLRTFRSLVDPEWAAALRDELGWLADSLGSARDGDVMLARMRKRAGELRETPAAGLRRVLATLQDARDHAYAELLATLRSERYLALLDRLVAAANAPCLLLEADRPAAEILPGLVRGPWRALAKRARDLGEAPTDEALHEVRIRTKRVRYAAEAVAPLVGRQSRQFATAAAKLQDVLGDLNDAVVAEAWLHEWTRGSRSVQGAFVAGELAGLERARAQRSRKRWRKAWKRLSSPKLRSWM